MIEIFLKFKEKYEEYLKVCKHPLAEYHLEGDVWTHTMLVFNQTRQQKLSKVLQIVALLHDIGKPYTQKCVDGKVIFSGHENFGTLLAIPFLKELKKEERITEKEMIEILYLINYHGVFWRKSDKQIKKYFCVDYYRDFYNNLYTFSMCDMQGNISFDERNAKEKIKDFAYYASTEKENVCYILIGLPGVGKTTYAKNFSNVVSRDDVLIDYAREKGFFGDYNELWEKLTKDDQEQIDRRLQQIFNMYKNRNEDFVIDMTNISWKSRRKWLTQLKNHKAVGVCFLEGILETAEENRNRPGKNINFLKLCDFAKRFELPLITEGFHSIQIKIS